MFMTGIGQSTRKLDVHRGRRIRGIIGALAEIDGGDNIFHNY